MKIIFDLPNSSLLNIITEIAKDYCIKFARKYHYIEIDIPIIDNDNGMITFDYQQVIDFLKDIEKKNKTIM